jgi:uncharacterized SAM-binding protein YcdF (DUF218 family)
VLITAKRARRLTIVVAVLLVVGLTARLFVWPTLNKPEHADAIVVLAGGGNRAAAGVSLADRGLADTLAFSIYKGQQCVPSTQKIHVICFVANPVSTRGEARAVGRLAAKYHWHRIILVALRPQATRARLRVGRCFAGQLQVVGVSPGSVIGWIYNIGYEWAALLKAEVWQRSC